jgi:hypothetical protein
VALPGLAEQDIHGIVVGYLEEYCKELEPAEIGTICRMEQARNPLYLLVMLNELRALGGNDMQRVVRSLIAELPRTRPGTVSLFEWRLEGTVALSDHPVRLPPLRRSKTTDHGHGRVVRPFLGALP